MHKSVLPTFISFFSIHPSTTSHTQQTSYTHTGAAILAELVSVDRFYLSFILCRLLFFFCSCLAYFNRYVIICFRYSFLSCFWFVHRSAFCHWTWLTSGNALTFAICYIGIRIRIDQHCYPSGHRIPFTYIIYLKMKYFTSSDLFFILPFILIS